MPKQSAGILLYRFRDGEPDLPPKITPTRVFINKKEEGKKRFYYLTAGDAKDGAEIIEEHIEKGNVVKRRALMEL